MQQIEALIRGEMAAVQSFDTVLNKIKDKEEKQRLSSIRMDHLKAVDTLKKYSGTTVSGTVDTAAGPWGSFSKAFVGGASFFGDKAAIRALKVGEEHGVQEYKIALNDASVSADLKKVIKNELLPQQQRHVLDINNYLH